MAHPNGRRLQIGLVICFGNNLYTLRSKQNILTLEKQEDIWFVHILTKSKIPHGMATFSGL